VEGEPEGLYVSRGNVYVTCSASRLIKVYSGDGLTCLRSLKLQQDISNPWHAIPLPDSDRFLVSHGLEGGRLHRLCVIDNTGKVRDRRLASAEPTVPTAPPMRLPIPNPNPNPNPKTHPNPNPIFKNIFLTLTRTFFGRKQKRHRNIGQHRVNYRLFTKGRRWVYQRTIP